MNYLQMHVYVYDTVGCPDMSYDQYLTSMQQSEWMASCKNFEKRGIHVADYNSKLLAALCSAAFRLPTKAVHIDITVTLPQPVTWYMHLALSCLVPMMICPGPFYVNVQPSFYLFACLWSLMDLPYAMWELLLLHTMYQVVEEFTITSNTDKVWVTG